MQEFNIRPIVESDLDEIFLLTKEFSTSFKLDKFLFENSFSNLLQDFSSCFLLAENNSSSIGYCLGFEHYTLYANGKVAWLEEIFIKEAYRRQGIASKLMKTFEDWSKSRNSKLIGLATRRAKDFYSSIGYEESAIYFRKIL